MPTRTPTPGPWTVATFTATADTYRAPEIHGRKSQVARVFGFDIGEAEANASLIAAAPSLLAACESVLEEFDDLYDGPDHPLNAIADSIRYLRAALDLAHGGTP